MNNERYNLTVLLTSCCTLRCRLCATYTPLVAQPHHYSYETITRSVDRFFSCMGSSNLFTLGGGEPLLHPQLPELLESFNKWIPQCNKFEITTNGTVVPNTAVLQQLSRMEKVDILVDNYGPELSKKVPEIADAFLKYGITFRIRDYYSNDAHCGGWTDSSVFREKQHDDIESERLFSKCEFRGGVELLTKLVILADGMAFMCYNNHKLVPWIHELDDEHVDMLNESLSNEEIKRKIISLRDRKRLSVCSFCNGYVYDTKRYPAAEQLP